MTDKEVHEKGAESNANTIHRLSRRRLWILVAFCVVVIMVLVGVFGGIIATRKNNPDSKNASSSSGVQPSRVSPSGAYPSRTTSSTMYPIQTIKNDGLSAYRTRPNNNKEYYTTVSTPGQPGQTFRIRCSWLPRFEKNENASGNLFRADVDSLEKCIEMCADYNARNGTDKAGPCRIVSWRWNKSVNFFGRCWGPAAEGQLWQGIFTNALGSAEAPVDTAIMPL